MFLVSSLYHSVLGFSSCPLLEINALHRPQILGIIDLSIVIIEPLLQLSWLLLKPSVVHVAIEVAEFSLAQLPFSVFLHRLQLSLSKL